MKKKIISIIIILTLFMFINTKEVKAAGSNHELIYDIENFNVTESKITFEGWAFINNYHNYGGSNTTITITAKSGNKSLSGKTEYNSYRNESLYQANCDRHKGIGKSCVESHDAATCKGTNGSSCRYDNVGFKVVFSIEKLIKQLGDGKTINFELSVTTNGKTQKNNIAVSTEASNVKDGDVIEGKNTIVKISDISDSATIRVGTGRVLATTAGDFAWGGGFYWAKNVSYKIKSISNSTRSGFNALKIYELEYNYGSTTKCSSEDANGKYGCKKGYANNKSGNTGWAYASWLQVDGYVKIILGEVDEPTSKCPSPKNSKPGNLNCSNGNYEQVKLENVNLVDRFAADYSKYNLKSQECSDHSGSITRTITATACITQSGVATFEIDQGNIYSGGGFYFSANYYSTTKYEFCKRSSRYNVTMTITDKYCDEYSSSCKISDTGCGEEGKNACYESCTKTRLSSETKEYELTKNSEEWNLVTEYMNTLIAEPNDNATTQSLNSNVVGGGYETIGNWSSSYSHSNSNNWEPGEIVEYSLDFNLKRACINRKTSQVRYTTGTCNSSEIDGDILYYIPLKQKAGSFPIKVTASDVNVLANQIWKINYECGVSCQQKLYENNGSFKFIYRPIDMSNPFPNRSPGNNWKTFMYDVNANKINATNKLNRNNLEYTVTLTPEDISNIKKYNKNAQENNKNYTSLKTIDDSGFSYFLDTYGFDIQLDNTYNKLGECTKECWQSDSMYAGIGGDI